MNDLKFSGLAIAALLALASNAFAASGTAISVTEYDKGATADMATDHGLDMANMKMPSDMGLRLSLSTVPAGEVTFQVKNSSTEVTHQVLVFPYVEGKPFLYDADLSMIDEEKAGKLGEVLDTEPGKTGELKLTLAPGKYALICNIPGHFANGMWAVLTVN
jgi:uncharacterized cupredoxin-like copper-binding protein